jgi:HK97 gp10 family phage protein
MAAANETGITIRVVSNRIPGLPAEIHDAVVKQVAASTLDVEARAKQVVAVRTGTLRRSIHSIFENGGLKGICGPSVEYSTYVEFGTRHRAARPYMRPAAEAVLPKFVEQLRHLLSGIH